FVQLELERAGEHGTRGDLQGAADRGSGRQIRPRGQAGEGIRDGELGRLPDRDRPVGRGSLELASAESDAEALREGSGIVSRSGEFSTEGRESFRVPTPCTRESKRDFAPCAVVAALIP